MIDNRKEDYTHEINRYTRNIIDGLIPKRIVPFDYYEERDIDEEVKNWIERSDGGFAVIVGEAGFGKTSLLCNIANALHNEGPCTVFFVKSENLRGKDFDKKILEDFEIAEMGLNAFLRKRIDENNKVIFLLDTLDVIATDDGIARLDDFLTKVKGENRVVIGASRPLEFKKTEHLTTKTFALKPFLDDEIRRLFEKYKAFYNMEGVELRLPVLEVCRNPLHMRMLFEVYQPNEIPQDINTQKLYDRYWDKKVAEIRIGALSHLDEGKKRKMKSVKEDLTKNIALEMLASKRITLRKSDTKKIKDKIKGEYLNQYFEVKNSTDVKVTQKIEIKELNVAYDFDSTIGDAYHDLLDEGVLRAQEDSVEFFHQSFIEYATARAVIENEDKEQLEYLLSNTTLLENRGIIQQVILYAKRKKKDEIAHEFQKKLLETNLYTKILAIDLLRHIENTNEEDIEIYLHLTKDKIEIRIFLVESLELIIPIQPDLASRLIENLSTDEVPTVQSNVAKVLPMLLEVNPDLASRLIENIGYDEDRFLQIKVAKVLSEFLKENPESATRLIENLTKDESWGGLTDVAAVLDELLDEDLNLISHLIKNLSTDGYEVVRKAVAMALQIIENLDTDGYADERTDVAEVLPTFFEKNPDITPHLIENLSTDEDWEELENLSTDGYADERMDIAEALPMLFMENPESATRLIENLITDEDPIVRSNLTKALPMLFGENPDIASRLIENLSTDEDWIVRRNVAGVLRDLFGENPDIVSRLIENLSTDEDWVVRRNVVEALQMFLEGNPNLASRLIENLSTDEDPIIRRNVAEALLKFAELYPNKTRTLIEKLKDSRDLNIQKAIKEIIEKRLNKG